MRQLLEKSNNNVIKGVGHGGVNQDSNGVSGDCGEEINPLSISTHGVLIFSRPSHSNVRFFGKNTVFPAVDEVRSFLEENLVVADDCCSDLKIDISAPEAPCDETMFDLKVTDLQCVYVDTKRYLLLL